MLRGNRLEEDNHDDVIKSIALETQSPIPIVKQIFEAELSRLKARARVSEYVVLFASRRTRAELLASNR